MRFSLFKQAAVLVAGLTVWMGLATPAGAMGSARPVPPTSGATSSGGQSFRIQPATTQLIVGIAPDWNSSHATLQRYERQRGGSWRPVGQAVPARLGRSGLVWGLGLHPVPQGATLKQEGDGRAPAGAFALGGAYGYEQDVRRQPGLPYHQVTEADMWVEDPQSPHYNRHLRMPHASPRTQWEHDQQMRQNDPAHVLKLFIAHNSGQRVVPNGGSAIFFHVWRDQGGRPSAGCTVMAEPALRELVAWVDPRRFPVYVLLPQAEYQRLRGPWDLP